MTTEERIAELERKLDKRMLSSEPLVMLACEIRALRLMLREEIREAGFALRVGRPPDGYGDALASRKAPDPHPGDGQWHDYEGSDA